MWSAYRGRFKGNRYKIGNKRKKRGAYAAAWERQHAVNAIANVPSDDPMFLMVGFVAPHKPWKPAKQYKNADVGPTINRADRLRKRTLLSVDDAVPALAQAMGPRWDNACVLVMSDHGYLLGEHGTTGKSLYWDEVTRVPALVRCPGIQGASDDRLAATIDVAPTILRAAGASMNHPLDGRPLQDAWDRESILVESWAKQSSGQKRSPFTAIKGKDWLYVEEQGLAPRYYAHQNEDVNVIDSLSDSERARLASWLDELRTCQGDSCRAAE